jgi:hypothetical protein
VSGPSGGRLRRKETTRLQAVASPAAAVVLAAASLATSGCSSARSDFGKAASDAASTFSAAATTLRLTHDGRVPPTYAVASFVTYRDALSGLEEKLRSAGGGPDRETVDVLVALSRAAMNAIRDPCLDDGCDWQGQVGALESARESFLRASP